MELTAGRRAEITVVVGEQDTAAALGSGDVPVLGTPRLLALAEAATVRALDGAGTIVGLGTVERVVVDRDKFLARLPGPS
jgi:predicted thioesterase